MKEYLYKSPAIRLELLAFCVLSVLCGESETLIGFFVLADEQKGITMMTTLLGRETPGSQKLQDIALRCDTDT